MKKFNFEKAKTKNSPEKLKWLKDNYNKDTSEEDFNNEKFKKVFKRKCKK